jgi:hypothetical protein
MYCHRECFEHLNFAKSNRPFKTSDFSFESNKTQLMEERTLRNVNNYLNTNIYSYIEASGGQSSNIYLKVVYFFNTSVN